MKNEPAFPMPSGPEPRVNQFTHYNEGISMLDYFAAKAMQAMFTRYNENARQPIASNIIDEAIAKQAYDIAEAMLAESNRRQSNETTPSAQDHPETA